MVMCVRACVCIIHSIHTFCIKSRIASDVLGNGSISVPPYRLQTSHQHQCLANQQQKNTLIEHLSSHGMISMGTSDSMEEIDFELLDRFPLLLPMSLTHLELVARNKMVILNMEKS